MENNTKDTDKILGLSRPVFLAVVILLCVLSICLGIYAQFFYKYSKSDPLMFGLGRTKMQDEEEVKRLKNEFETIFTNDIEATGDYSYKKLDGEKDIVYTSSEISKETENYSININIPQLNIDSETGKQINDEINSIFTTKFDNITKQSSSINTIYNISYKAYINGDLLSLVIKSNLKEGANSQTTMIKAYNYNLANNEKASFREILTAKGLEEKEVQAEIDDNMKYLNQKDEELKETTNYQIKLRNLDSDIYKLDNIDNFMVSKNGYLYVIFAYGNEELTSKYDLVIFK